MIPKIIHYCWFGRSSYPAIVRKCIDSWAKYCPDYEIKLWNEDNYDVGKVPYIKEAYENKKWAFVSDYARLDIIYHEGGIYLDTDVELVRSLDDLLNNNSFFTGDGSGINTGLGFGAAKENNVVGLLLKEYEGKHFINNGKMDLTVCTEPNSRIFLSHGYDKSSRNIQQILGTILLPPQYFSPIEGEFSELNVSDKTYGIHWGSRSWESGLTKIKADIRLKLGADKTSKLKKILGGDEEETQEIDNNPLPKFSFIIPVYNSEHVIDKCIESVLTQTYRDFEIIIVDDGSTDESLDVCRKFSGLDSRIHVYTQKNSGPGIARNYGISKSRGDFILFLDSDDWWNENSSLAEIASTVNETNCDVVVFNVLETVNDGATLTKLPYFSFFSDIPETYLTGRDFLQTVLSKKYDYAWLPVIYAFRREKIVKNAITFPARRLGEDTATIFRILLKSNAVHIINKYFYVYRKGNAKSLSSSESLEKLEGIVDITQKCICYVNSQNDIPEELKSLLCNNFAAAFFTAMIRANSLPKDDLKKMVCFLKNNEGIMNYSISKKQVTVRRIIHLIGLKRTIKLLGIRRQLRTSHNK